MSENPKKVKRWAGRELKKEGLILERFFRLTENKTDITTELLAGLATFITVAYILAVNPNILSASGMPKGGVFIATALAAAVGSALMGFLGNYPFVLAPGLGTYSSFFQLLQSAKKYSISFPSHSRLLLPLVSVYLSHSLLYRVAKSSSAMM